MQNEREIIRLIDPVTESDHSYGPADAPATLVEYGDYECPACRDLHPLLYDLVLKRTSGLRFIYRHFPLGSYHPNAARAAEAAEAANAQDKFWQMHVEVFGEKPPLTDDRLTKAARRAGLDLDKYHREMGENLYQAKVAEAYESALYGGGVTGTPTLYLNGVRLSRLQTLQDLVEAVTEAGASLQERGPERHQLLERLRQFRIRRTQLKA